MKFKKILQRILKIIVWTFTLVMFLTILCNIYINRYSAPYLYSTIDQMPKNKYCILLGTSKYTVGKNPNKFFDNRITAGVNLWEAKKVQYIIVSGDNRENNYDEPQTLKEELIKFGIPDSCILKDDDGYRTYNSLISCKAKFGLKSVTTVSQEFHNSRAVFLARQLNIDAIGYNASDVSFSQGYRVYVREWFAKVKAIIEITL